MLKFFLTFVMMGFLSFGGGYALLPIMEGELVGKLGWLSHQDFVLAVAAGQVSPGPVAVAGSFAGFMSGYKLYGTFSGGLFYAFLAWLGINLSTLVCMGLIMGSYEKITKRPEAKHIYRFVMPVIIGLIFYLALKMGVSSLTGLPQVAIALAAFLLAFSKKIDYVYIIIAGGAAGFFIK